MPNCPRGGFHICAFVGNVKTGETAYIIPGVNIGPGASGAPMTINHDTNRNLGYTYSNHANYDNTNNRCITPHYDPNDFNNLLKIVSNN